MLVFPLVFQFLFGDFLSPPPLLSGPPPHRTARHRSLARGPSEVVGPSDPPDPTVCIACGISGPNSGPNQHGSLESQNHTNIFSALQLGASVSDRPTWRRGVRRVQGAQVTLGFAGSQAGHRLFKGHRSSRGHLTTFE